MLQTIYVFNNPSPPKSTRTDFPISSRRYKRPEGKFPETCGVMPNFEPAGSNPALKICTRKTIPTCDVKSATGSRSGHAQRSCWSPRKGVMTLTKRHLPRLLRSRSHEGERKIGQGATRRLLTIETNAKHQAHARRRGTFEPVPIEEMPNTSQPSDSWMMRVAWLPDRFVACLQIFRHLCRFN